MKTIAIVGLVLVLALTLCFSVKAEEIPLPEMIDDVVFPNSLEVGKHWSLQYEYFYGDRRMDFVTVVNNFEVESYERITVQSGTFWVFKIKRQSVVIPMGSKYMCYYYFSPDLNQVLKREGHQFFKN